jgi:hypothetical protein
MSAPSSTTFWSLINKWGVSIEDALELVSYEGNLPAPGKRPRFKLSADQQCIVARLIEIDSVLKTAGVPEAWLRKRTKASPRSPLDLMRAGATDQVLSSLAQAAFRASLKVGRRKKQPPA